MLKTLEELIAIIRQRKGSSAEESYTYKLLKNKKLSVEKIKEEIAELIQAIEKNTNKVHEAADVLYHLMVLLEANGIKIDGDFIESQAFAYLAVRSYLKLPISFPNTTGCLNSCTGGAIVEAK